MTTNETTYTFAFTEVHADAFRQVANVAAKRKPDNQDELITQWALEDFMDELSADQPVTVPRSVLNSLMSTLQSPITGMTDAEREAHRMTIVRIFNKPNPR